MLCINLSEYWTSMPERRSRGKYDDCFLFSDTRSTFAWGGGGGERLGKLYLDTIAPSTIASNTEIAHRIRRAPRVSSCTGGAPRPQEGSTGIVSFSVHIRLLVFSFTVLFYSASNGGAQNPVLHHRGGHTLV